MFGVTYGNPWIEGVDRARRRLMAWTVVVFAMGWAVLVLFANRSLAPSLYAAVGRAFAGAPAPWPAIAGQSARRAFVFVLLMTVALLAAGFEGRWLWRRGARPGASAAIGLVLGGAGLCASVAIASMAGVVTAGGDRPLAAGIGGLAIGVAGVAFQTATEEVYFRGWLQPLLCARWGPWLGVLSTAALFTLLHLVGGARSLFTLLNLFLGGLMFGLLALRTGGLWAPWAAHFAWNWAESGGLGLDPNPGSPLTGVLVDLDLKGPALWSGGADALNGSLATVIVLMLIVGALAGARVALNLSAPPAERRSGFAP
jgi:membrane protease YdiL (CAAX protease family)